MEHQPGDHLEIHNLFKFRVFRLFRGWPSSFLRRIWSAISVPSFRWAVSGMSSGSFGLVRSGIIAFLEPWFSNRTKTLVETPKLHFCDSGLCAFLMGMQTLDNLYTSPLNGALWETPIFSDLRRLLSVRDGWQLHSWRDRSKKADFLLHKAGRFHLADAKFSGFSKTPFFQFRRLMPGLVKFRWNF